MLVINEKPVKIFEVWAYDDDHGRNPTLRNFHLNSSTAGAAKKGIGWYGSDGYVVESLAVKDIGGMYWRLTQIGVMADDMPAYNKMMQEDIAKAVLSGIKLSEEQLKFLKDVK